MPRTHAEIHKQDANKKAQYDDRIIEARGDVEQQVWRFMRIPDDKPHANYISVLESIIKLFIEPVYQKDARVLP
jgi:hypothetical protein